VDDEVVEIGVRGIQSGGEGWGEERVELEVGPVGRGRDKRGEEGGFGCAIDLPEEGVEEGLDDPVPDGVAERTYSYHLINISTA
jgi:hypothetical protein